MSMSDWSSDVCSSDLQIDGAGIFDASGTLRQLGVRLVPTAEAESKVEGFKGMRHTSARRYSYDDPRATVIVVSEDGPATVFRKGDLLGISPEPQAVPDDDDACPGAGSGFVARLDHPVHCAAPRVGNRALTRHLGHPAAPHP